MFFVFFFFCKQEINNTEVRKLKYTYLLLQRTAVQALLDGPTTLSRNLRAESDSLFECKIHVSTIFDRNINDFLNT